MAGTMLDFYRQHGISPVRQDISDLEKHFFRRRALYLQLGIVPALVKGARVMEIGPGSGSNSIYTASLEPAEYHLVEPNPKGVEDIEALFAKWPKLKNGLVIHHSTLEDLPEMDKFDMVMAEGFLSGLPDPESALKKIAGYVAPGGVFLISCVDEVSFCAEALRLFLAQMLIDPADTSEKKLSVLLPVFSPHLGFLPAMSRSHEDWIVDTLLCPWYMGTLLPFPKAAEVLSESFEFYGSSPHFVSDWRWYKSITDVDNEKNRISVEQYWANVHNFLDHRKIFPPRSVQSNRELHEICLAILNTTRLFVETRELTLRDKVLKLTLKLISSVEDFSPEVADSLREAYGLIEQEPLDPNAIAQSQKFASLFGRGQQYVSLIRRG